MRQFNRILGFVAVSFVLVFLGKVSKTSLYTVYFKTIADVEIRNSHALDLGDAHFDLALTDKSSQAQPNNTAPGAGDLAKIDLQPLTLSAQGDLLSNDLVQAEPLGLRCFMDVAPRAPGA
ncbi:MAG TPA: hypothetical protein VHS96_05600 [Bacteroidia bacterium]|jgi:hypothetical protein|nr:hypothetical protein [Bacteroidia bacterium]